MTSVKKLIYEKAIPVMGIVKESNNKFVQVVYYHDVVNQNGSSYIKINVDLFKKQMLYIKENGYKTLLFSELDTESENRDRTVLICFDDGWKSNYTEIFEFMKSTGIKYNIFLAAGSIGVDKDYLTWGNVEEMSQSSMVEFAAHTYNHVVFDDLSKYDMKQEIDLTDSLIEKHTGKKPYDFCLPKGVYTEKTLKYLLDKTAYKRIYTSDLQYSQQVGEKIVFGRAAISNDEPFSVFVNKLKGRFNCFNEMKGRHGFGV